MSGICATRMLKNAKFIRKAAPHIIPPQEPLDGFKSLVPLDILRRFDRMSDSELTSWPELLTVKQTLDSQLKDGLRPLLFGDPPFKGTLHFVQLAFFTEADGGTVTLPSGDIETAIEYATLATVPISVYCSQYGSNHLEVSPNILSFGIAVTNTVYNDDAVQAMVNSILEQNQLDTSSSCIVLLNPPGAINTDAALADGVLGYHDKANAPYCFVNVMGFGLTVDDRQDLYADTLSHETAEMTCDPDDSIFNHEVCDGCAGNCNNSWRNFFGDPSLSMANPLSYLQSSMTFPATPFTYFIASVATRPHADDCPAPGSACAYGPPIPRETAPGHAQVWPVTRSADHLDIFVTDDSGSIQTAAWEPDFADGWHGWWSINGGAAAPGAPIHGVSRSADKLDLFVIGTDDRVYTAAWEPDFADGWHGWWRLLDGVAAPGAHVTAVSRSADHLDVFVIGTDGGVYTAAWEPDFADGWHGWSRIGNLVAPQGAPVHCVSRSTDHLDIFVTDSSGSIQTAAWEPDFADGWHGWWSINGGAAAPGAPVTPVSRSTDKLDIFITGTDGHVYTAAWEPDFADGWHGWTRIGNLVAPQGAPVHCVSRSTDHLDIFVTDSSGSIQTAAWEPDFADGWHGWWSINGGAAAPGAPVTPVSRSTDKLDIFVIGTDDSIYTAAWEPDFADGWHGWTRMGALSCLVEWCAAWPAAIRVAIASCRPSW